MSNSYVNMNAIGYTGNNLIDSLTWGSAWVPNGTMGITVGYDPTDYSYNSGGGVTGSRAVTADESAAIQNMLATYSKYIDVQFTFIGADAAGTADIDFVFLDDPSSGNLGMAEPPGFNSSDPNHSRVWVYTNGYTSVQGSLQPGGYDYITLVHEFGHAMGLAHPHDNGGTDAHPSEIMTGVNSAFDSYGNDNLNQGIFTTMSYNDGWPLGGISQKAKSYGYQSGPMALDIQALQLIYGANENYAIGNDTYALPVNNAAGTAYSCIWDAGGDDTIVMYGIGGCTIDLRAATGQPGAGGGGYVSHGTGIRGGFTIAVGAEIENAVGGAGADILRGNALDNSLTGKAGKDTMTGDLGEDTFVFTAPGDSSSRLTKADVITDFTEGTDQIDLHGFDASSTHAGMDHFSYIGVAGAFSGTAQVRSVVDAAHNRTLVYLNTDADKTAEAAIILTGQHTLTADDFIFV
jgi:serralysin